VSQYPEIPATNSITSNQLH